LLSDNNFLFSLFLIELFSILHAGAVLALSRALELSRNINLNLLHEEKREITAL